MTINAIASAVYNDVMSGLVNITSDQNISLEQLEDEVVEERQSVIKEWWYKNILNPKDLLLSINCIPVDCADPAKCCKFHLAKPTHHFEIPQLMNDIGDDAIEFVGSVDREIQFKYYTSTSYQYHKYKRNRSNEPYVYIETTPNENGMYDGWIYNAPFVKYISIIGIFKDPRQLDHFDCCRTYEYLDIGPISSEVKKRLTQRKFYYYRQAYPGPRPDNNIPT